MATGEKEGIYAAIGREYQEQLGKLGLKVELRYTQGSGENLQLLLDKKEKVDVAIVQAGTYTSMENLDPDHSLRGLAALQWEPVWFFYKKKIAMENLNDLVGKTIAIGPKQSGTALVAQSLLKANGIEKKNNLVNRSMQETFDGLVNKEGDLDAAFLVSSARNPLIQNLMGQEDIRLLSFNRQLAYSRLFPFLSPVVLGEGVMDLKKNLPPRDIKMFVMPTLLVCRKDLHPRAVEQILIEARRIHAKPALVSSPQQFPSLEGLDIPPHETALAYMQSGESVLTKWLPYWGVLLVFKLQLLLLPLLVVWLPFFRLLPVVYAFRINMLLRRHYSALLEIENKIEKAATPEVIQEQIQALDQLRKTMEKVSRKIPTHLQIHVFQWRLHVSHVRDEAEDRLRLMKGLEKPQKPTAPMNNNQSPVPALGPDHSAENQG